MSILLTLFVAIIGGILAIRMKVPAGAIVGAIISVAFVSIAVGLPEVPGTIKTFTQIIAGAYIGTGLTRKSIYEMKSLALPALLLIVSFMLTNIMLGLGIYYFSPLDLCTSLFAVVPGGLAEMSVIADDMGANTAIVSVFQIARLASTMCVFPILITRIMHAEKRGPGQEINELDTVSIPDKGPWWEFGLTLITATAAGLLGQVTNFPGGTLLFSVTSTGFLKIKTNIGYVPKSAKRLAQIFIGAYIGAKITRSVLVTISSLWPYVIVVVVSYFLCCLLTGLAMSKLTDVDKITAAFSCTPAGSSDMALIASEFGTVTPTIAALQIIRVVGVIAIFPSMISLILKLAL